MSLTPTQKPKYQLFFDLSQVGQHCVFGDCFNNTVCMCQENLCNEYGLTNATTPAPVTMTTTNMTMSCWYGMESNHSADPETWQQQICGPMESACMVIHNDDGFTMANCYDFR